MITRLWDRSLLHMLPYPTHAHHMKSAHGHAYSHPNPDDHSFQKYHGRSGLASHPTNVRARTRVWRTTITKIKTQGLDENTIQNNTQLKTTQEDGFYMNPKANKTIHHEITQPTSIGEYGFYTNPNDVTRPKVMDSLHQPQFESVDSTWILVSMKQKQRSKRNQTTGNNSLNRTQSWEYECDTHPNAKKHAKVVWLISKRIIQVHDSHCAKKIRENRAARKMR